jgi:predicted kinase
MSISKLNNIIAKCSRPYILILVGPPLCGKSSLVKKLNLKDVTIISRDEILLEESGTDNYSDAFKSVNQKKVNKILNESIETAADNKENVIIDMTNLSPKRRRSTLESFDNYYKVAVVFDIPSEEELSKRNKKRLAEENKFIPENVIKTMISSYIPVKNEEGFNKIVYL